MKISTLLLFLISISSYSQIKVSGASTYPALNITFNPVAAAPTNNCYITFNDAGTNIYYSRVNYSGYYIDYYIIRRGGRWVFEGLFNGFEPHYIYYMSNATSTDINPSCSNTWQIWTGNCTNAFGSYANTGNTTSNITLTGTCSSIPERVSTIYPNNIQLPQMTTSQINTIVTPQKGMMVFDVTSNTVKVFDGSDFKILLHRGYITLVR